MNALHVRVSSLEFTPHDDGALVRVEHHACGALARCMQARRCHGLLCPTSPTEEHAAPTVTSGTCMTKKLLQLQPCNPPTPRYSTCRGVTRHCRSSARGGRTRSWRSMSGAACLMSGVGHRLPWICGRAGHVCTAQERPLWSSSVWRIRCVPPLQPLIRFGGRGSRAPRGQHMGFLLLWTRLALLDLLRYVWYTVSGKAMSALINVLLQRRWHREAEMNSVWWTFTSSTRKVRTWQSKF